MKISIVMTTYNGEKYLTEQLDSLRKQTRTPDEVIIFDDCSSDSTNSMIDSYIQQYSLKGWIHKVNAVNLGWKKNFMEAIGTATGDIVFTCDQDDIWYESKLEIMEKVMIDNPQINLIVSEYDLKCKNKKSKYSIGKVWKYAFDKKFIFTMYPGCVYCFRKTLFGPAKQMWFDDYPHDSLIWHQAIMTDSLYVYDEPFIFYRRHEGTATGREKRNTYDKIKMMSEYIKILSKMQDYIDNNIVENSDNKKRLIKKCDEWCRLRIKFLESRNPILWIKLFRYIKNYYNFKSYLGDLVVKILRG